MALQRLSCGAIGAELVGRSQRLRGAGARPGPHFATRYLKGVYTANDTMWLRAPAESFANTADVPAFVVFDVFVHNTDRHGGNTLLAPPDGRRETYRYILTDHGHCLGGPEWSQAGVHGMPHRLAGVLWPTDNVAGADDFAGPAGLAASLGPDRIDEARRGLPAERDVPAADYRALRDALPARCRSLILDATRAGADKFAGWRGKIDRGGGP